MTTGRPTIQQGGNGQAVRDLQDHLKRNFPAYAGHLAVDGAFGPKTKAAVVEFQRRSGLVADGIVGPKTWGKLGI
jgi:peptidoglycan hydrolase-like protein with peptidoglycan-binding domain